uniref:Mutant acetylcholine receptor DES-2-like protein n=1 Tax=Haemonchus contortus TaxID=6289 RepID=C1KA35_HAECO|nr:mutant acetylcholine receptor DES-2-like protein [Haemonchus contortus]ACO48385.1 mutant acetylcholine receptor DES-2-like protein [Haemonchus contortus]ACO48386.1 mutant acetylcholine receptor DES-2-like protein [Haemonchus contortus]ACO48387.1 mutant acetylcholine receptor DES-2-like protein [Haemonchus contortus]ACO48388.1 mutant acetylcholine receptor DES-2-like protein [Haemonchus contortus]
MTRVGRGTITGTPLAPDEQVLRAVCKWIRLTASWSNTITVQSRD